jgi:acyl carrier protein
MITTEPTLNSIAEHLQLCLPRIPLHTNPNTRLADLALDSLDTVELLCVIHEEFGVRLTETDFNPAQTLQSLLTTIRKNLDSQTRSQSPVSLVP